MESLLKESKTSLANLNLYRRVRVVLGNQTCDLDSAVCALVQALSHYYDKTKANLQEIAVVPVMNILEKEFRMKTEVIYYLRKHNVPLEMLTFRDQINLQSLSDEKLLDLTLVDHHTLSKEDLPLASSVVEIIDHRPQDKSWSWSGKTINLQLVGSCATLVARNMLQKHAEMVDSQVSNLLRGPILIDTCNFSKEADRATPWDVEIIQKLEEISSVTSNRDEVYKQILAAKTDISGLTPSDLLARDLKVANGIPISGLPILVKNYIKMEGAYEAMNLFTREKGSSLTIVMGLDLKNDIVTRDIAIFSLSPNELQNKIMQALTTSDNPKLDLTIATESLEESYNFVLYKQGNVRASRKQILPIVQSLSVGCQC